MEKAKKFLSYFLRIFMIFLLVENLSSLMDTGSWGKYSTERWLGQGLKSIYAYTEGGEKLFNFIKFLSTLAIYFIVELDSIINIANFPLGFKEVIKYHSKSKFDYVKNTVRTTFTLNWRDIFYWLLVFIIPIILFKGSFLDEVAIAKILIFIGSNYIFNFFIALISLNPLMSVVLYTAKHTIFSVFIDYELLLIFIIFMIIFILFSVKQGDSL